MIKSGENLQTCGGCGGYYLLTDIVKELPGHPQPTMVYEMVCEECNHTDEIQCWDILVAAAFADSEISTDDVRAMFALWGLDYETERRIFMPRIRKAECGACQDTKLGQRWDASTMMMVSEENSCPYCCGVNPENAPLVPLPIGQPLVEPFGANAVDAVIAARGAPAVAR